MKHTNRRRSECSQWSLSHSTLMMAATADINDYYDGGSGVMIMLLTIAK